MTLTTPTVRFGSTIILTGQDRDAVQKKLLEYDAQHAFAFVTGPDKFHPNQFRGRVITDDAQGNDASKLLELMGIPFTPGSDKAQNDAQLGAIFSQLPADAIHQAVAGYSLIKSANGKAQMIDVIV